MVEAFTGHRIVITSGCRCWSRNASDGIQGKDDSYHLPGLSRTNDRGRKTCDNICEAADWFPSTKLLTDVIEEGEVLVPDKRLLVSLDIIMEPHFFGGWHLYLVDGFIHSDVRRSGRARW